MSNHFPQTEIPQRERGAQELYDAEALWDLDFFGAVAPVVSNLKAWNGGSWVPGIIKRWNGTSWDTIPLKRWNGIAWV